LFSSQIRDRVKKRVIEKKTSLFFHLRLGLVVPVEAPGPLAPELADLAVLPRADADHLRVDGGRDAVVDLAVDLGEHVPVDHRRVLEVSDRRGVDDVADDEALDGLVLGDEDPGGLAADAFDLLR